MKEIKRIQDVAFAASSSFSQEFQGRAFDALSIKFDAAITADGTGISTVVTDPAARLCGQYELFQDETPLIRASLISLYWMGSLTAGSPGHLHQDATVAISGTSYCMFETLLNFSRLAGPFAMVDARPSKVYTRGQFGAVTDYSPNLASASGKLRQSVRTTLRTPEANGGYFRPRWYELTVDLSVASSQVPLRIRFEEDSYVPGFLVIAHDESAKTAADPDAARVNTLIRTLQMDLQSAGTNGEVYRESWGQALYRTWSGCGFAGNSTTHEPLTEIPQGVVWVPTTDERERQANGSKLFRRGDAVNLMFDTTSTIENELGTAVTAASGDKATVLVPAFVPSNPNATAFDPGSERNLRQNVQRAARAGLNVRARVGGLGA